MINHVFVYYYHDEYVSVITCHIGYYFPAICIYLMPLKYPIPPFLLAN